MTARALLDTVRRKVRKTRQMGVRAAARQGYHEAVFRFGPRLEWAGIQVLPAHYYSPVPSLHQLRADPRVLTEPSQLLGIDIDLDRQRSRLAKLASVADELRALPPYQEFEKLSSGEGYGVADAEILYAWIRATKPRRVLEVGSGVSTRYAVAALAANVREGQTGETARITCVEPFRWHGLETLGGNGVEVEVIRELVQHVDLSVFESLQAGDILFIDSTHVVKTGSDTSFLFLEVLPRLAPGVVVHVHDIPLPFEFVSPSVMLDEHMFWNEVAIVRALLMYNHAFRVELASYWMAHFHRDELTAAVPSLRDEGVISPSSLWIERVGA